MLPPLKRHADRLRRAAVLGIVAGGAATPAFAGPPPCPPPAYNPCPPAYNPCPPGVITPVTPAPPAPMDGSATELLPETFSRTAPPSPAAQNLVANTANPLAGRSGLAAVGGGVGDPGYIDPAVVASRFRLRYSGARDGNSDRGEFLYGAYDTPALQASLPPGTPAVFIGPGNPGNVAAVPGQTVSGPTGPVRPVIDGFDYDEISAYLELEVVEGVSAFVEVPWRDVSGYDQFRDQGFADDGLGDINAGVRVSLYDDCDTALTFQLMYQTNTGDPDFGLGNGTQFIVPGLLFQQSLSDDLHLFGEAQYYVDAGNGTEFNGEDYTSDVLRFGLGAALDLVETRDTNLQLLNEFVGWTFYDGQQSEFNPATRQIDVTDADGETIVNYKVGLRYLFGRQSVYAGYGLALTDDVLYDDIVRLEYSVLLD
ncbi:hypothetical protein [Alienimonas californiensis]|uniref:Porin n=1 Tax=Alienimonas californiensis TaxID=2527989 RepID=A0A517P432_9PLAN|nr:hypothetical protein [Alienimonas californiensis]QDT14103.1 hypothetical protein CA12_01710 [Alienimonas californiensis]